MADPLTSSELRALRRIGRAWDRFFFETADPSPLGLIRIATGLLLLWSLGWLGTDLRGYLGSQGWIDQASLQQARHSDWVWSLWNFVPDRMLSLAWAGSMLVLLLFTLGVAGKVMAPLAWAIAVSTTRRNPFILHGFDQILTLWTFYLAVSLASSQAFSVDRWLARRKGGSETPKPTISANLGLRMIQINLAIVYGAAGVAKLRGMSWWDGSALIKTLGNAEFRPFDLTWILGTATGVYLLNLLTHLSMWTEVLYPVFVWKKATRPIVLVAVVMMHAGIALVMGLTEFSLAMLAGNLAFVVWPTKDKSSGSA